MFKINIIEKLLLKCVGLMSLFLAPTVAHADEMVVAAAVSLKKPFELIRNDFERKSGVHVNFSFAASGILAQQILHGAPVDVFAPASYLELGLLRAKGLIEQKDVRKLANNRLVLVVPSSSNMPPGLSILKTAKKIAVGNPSYTPSGRYAVQALKHLNTFEALEKQQKLVYTENVKQALTYAENGSVDAAIVYATDAITSLRVKVLHRFSENDTEIISYPIAIISSSHHRKAAQAFLEWCDSPSASEHLKEAGYLPKASAPK